MMAELEHGTMRDGLESGEGERTFLNAVPVPKWARQAEHLCPFPTVAGLLSTLVLEYACGPTLRSK